MKARVYRSSRLLCEGDLSLLSMYMIPVKYCGWSLYKCRICGCRFADLNSACSHLKNYHRLRGEGYA